MGEYWWKAITEAWKATKGSFGLNPKTIAASLVTVSGWLVTLANAGLPNVMTNLSTYFWYAVPIGFAGMVLFVWNFIQVQAAMYAAVHSQLRKLEIKMVTPDLSAWRQWGEFALYEAACLFAGIPPTTQIVAGSAADAWYGVIKSELESGRIKRIRGDIDDDHHTVSRTYRPHDGTMIDRGELKKVATDRKERPSFLFWD